LLVAPSKGEEVTDKGLRPDSAMTSALKLPAVSGIAVSWEKPRTGSRRKRIGSREEGKKDRVRSGYF